MIDQENDRISRGSLLELAMLGDSILFSVQYHKGSVDTQTGVLDWIKTWSNDVNLKLMELKMVWGNLWYYWI